MDHFEGIITTLLEFQGYWVRKSFKVNLSKEEKKIIGKPTMPRPEIDILALDFYNNKVLVIEAKSYLDSPGVRYDDVIKKFNTPNGRYKLFTCEKYRDTVISRLHKDLMKLNMANQNTDFILGMVAGKVYQNRIEEMEGIMNTKNWFFWSPKNIKQNLYELVEKGYENDPAIITAKILMRD